MDFTYTTGRLNGAEVADLAPDFETLAPSGYADGQYRLRRYSKIVFDRDAAAVELLPNEPFVQSSRLNRFQGGVARRYDDVLDSTWRSPGFAAMCRAFADEAELPARVVMEVHQLRISSPRPDVAVEAAPEGVHQDGFDAIAMFTVARSNAVGPQLCLHPAQDAPPAHAAVQQPGEYCVLNDAAWWHSATTVAAAAPGRPGTWDLFVLTANRAR